MGYCSEGWGRAEKVDVEAAKTFIEKHGDYGSLELNLIREKELLEMRFEFDKWYYEDDFAEEAYHDTGIFKDMRGILRTEPAVIVTGRVKTDSRGSG